MEPELLDNHPQRPDRKITNLLRKIRPIKDSRDTTSPSGGEKQIVLNDLTTVGPEKPLGYLPISTLVDIGIKPRRMEKNLKKRGLVVLELSEEESGVGGGALFAYDEQALSRILDEGGVILERNGWPKESAEFVRHLRVNATDPDLFRLIMKVFADPRLRWRQPLRGNSLDPA